jgi:hypothetical protein
MRARLTDSRNREGGFMHMACQGNGFVDEVSKKLGVELPEEYDSFEVLFSDCSAAYRRTGQIRT